MADGVVVGLNPEGRYGFIRPAGGGRDVFFHAAAVRGAAFDALYPGQRVAFERAPDPRDRTRWRATLVRSYPAGRA